MIYLLPESKFDSVKPLFDACYPQRSIALAIVESRIPGRIWVDNVESPTACLVATDFVFAFCAGRISLSIWNDFLDVLRSLKNAVKLECPFGIKDELLAIASEQEATLNTRIQFLYNPPVVTFDPSSVPEGFELVPITAKNFAKCGWAEPVFLKTYITTERYFENTHGFCVIDKSTGEVVSEAHAMIGDRSVTLGTMTHIDYRRRGFATLVCKKLAEYCLHRGLAIIWSCDDFNMGSVKLAQKIGFGAIFRYRYVNTATLVKELEPVVLERASRDSHRFFVSPKVTEIDVVNAFKIRPGLL